MKLTNARPGDDLERRDERGDVIVVQVVNVFTTTLPDSGANVRCADYRANGGGEVYRMRADQDPDVWTLVDACTACVRAAAAPRGVGMVRGVLPTARRRGWYGRLGSTEREAGVEDAPNLVFSPRNALQNS